MGAGGVRFTFEWPLACDHSPSSLLVISDLRQGDRRADLRGESSTQHKDKLGYGDGATFSGGGSEEWQSDVTVFQQTPQFYHQFRVVLDGGALPAQGSVGLASHVPQQHIYRKDVSWGKSSQFTANRKRRNSQCKASMLTQRQGAERLRMSEQTCGTNQKPNYRSNIQ